MMPMTKQLYNSRTCVLGLIFCGVLAYALYEWRHPPAIEVSIPRNTIIHSNFDFLYEHWKEEKLRQLREQENYTDLTAASEFAYFLKLCAWVHQQWESSDPEPYPLCNALDILADIRAGKTGGFCGQYAYVLADVLKSVGFFAVRYVELWSRTGESHFVVEVWSNEYEKWILLDPHQNLYYELEQTQLPANAYEIRLALLEPSAPRVIARQADDPTQRTTNPDIAVYAHFAVSLRADLLRHTKPLTIQDRFDMFLYYRDHYTDETVFQQPIFHNRIPYAHITTRPEDVYYDCNRVRVEYTIQKPTRQVVFQFLTEQSMPNFQFFKVSVDRGQQWERSADRYVFQGEPGSQHELWVAPVNMAGRIGSITKIFVKFP